MKRLRAAWRLGKDVGDVRVDLVIEKVGAEWCLFTKDKSRKLGCHPTKEAAEAQERAVQANTGRALAGEPVALGRSLLMLGADAVIAQMGCTGVLSHWEAWGETFDGCVSAMTGKVDDVEAFCGAFDHAAQRCGIHEHGGRGGEGRVLLSFDSRLTTDGAEVLPDGSARMDVRLAPESETPFQNGPTEFSLGAQQVREAVANFNKRGAPVPATIGHYPDDERQRQPAAAWIEKLYRQVIDSQAYLMATMRFLPKTWRAITSDEFKFLSMEFWREDTDQHGAPVGFNIDGAAILNYPFFPLRFDQGRSRGGSVLWLGRFGAQGQGGSMSKDKKDQDLAAGTEIRQVGSEWFIFNAAGEKLGKGHPSEETAKAALAELVGLAAKLGPAKKGEPADKDGKVEVGAVELAKLRQDSEELTRMKDAAAKKDGGEVVELRKKVEDLEKGRAEDQKRLKAQRIRAALSTLTKEHHVHVKLGDHKIETDEGAIKFLESRPFGVESVEGLEALAKDMEANAHLPRVRLTQETGGGAPGATGDAGDLTTKDGRAAAVRQRVTALRKEFPGEELERTLGKRGQTVEQFARQELKAQHPGIDWSKD